MDKPQALLLNFTANTYHWGCYGTSLEVWQTLVDRGYYVNVVDVREAHLWTNTPQQVSDFDDGAFGATFLKSNLSLYYALLSADVVIVNGEGTLHGPSKAAIHLLYVMYLAKVNFKKPVHLINSSFFPTDDAQSHDGLDSLYGKVARVLDSVVPRETLSREVLHRLGVSTVQGFDCLPRFIHRHGLAGSHVYQPTVVVAGGVNMTQLQAQNFGRLLASVHQAGVRFCFLMGAKSSVNQEDARIYQEMQSQCAGLETVTAHSMKEWLHIIGHSACMVSARYHHTLAAISLGTPSVVFPSNTPKINASMQMLGIDHIWSLDQDVSEIKDLISDALQQRLPAVAPGRVAQVVELAAHNFDGIV